MRSMIAVCALLLSAAPASALDDPGQLIKALYQLPGIPTEHRDIDRFFARDMAAAIKRDISGARPGDYSGGDWRFEGEDARIADWTFGIDGSRTVPTVTARFKNAGRPSTVIYEMCLGSQGWRIANVRNRGEDMRAALGIPRAPISC
jgi:hypothetical protein